jgi:hypothetical protein
MSRWFGVYFDGVGFSLVLHVARGSQFGQNM